MKIWIRLLRKNLAKSLIVCIIMALLIFAGLLFIAGLGLAILKTPLWVFLWVLIPVVAAFAWTLFQYFIDRW